ncbi:hypothetical protein Tco_0836300 [Tanacetum coccineum]
MLLSVNKLRKGGSTSSRAIDCGYHTSDEEIGRTRQSESIRTTSASGNGVAAALKKAEGKYTANLIANLKLDVDDNKKIQKQLKKANATLTQELTECKYILAETSRTLGESNSIQDSCLVALQNKQTEFKSQSIQTIHMLAPKCPTFNGRPTFANPMYLKKAQYEHPGLYAITQDQSDPATRLIPDREEILTLAEKSNYK